MHAMNLEISGEVPPMLAEQADGMHPLRRQFMKTLGTQGYRAMSEQCDAIVYVSVFAGYK
jgi:hypothetical protein